MSTNPEIKGEWTLPYSKQSIVIIIGWQEQREVLDSMLFSCHVNKVYIDHLFSWEFAGGEKCWWSFLEAQ